MARERRVALGAASLRHALLLVRLEGCVAGAGVSCPLCVGVAGTLALFMTDAIDCDTFW